MKSDAHGAKSGSRGAKSGHQVDKSGHQVGGSSRQVDESGSHCGEFFSQVVKSGDGIGPFGRQNAPKPAEACRFRGFGVKRPKVGQKTRGGSSKEINLPPPDRKGKLRPRC